MAQIKTASFLPEVYRTQTNQKFLNATLDQLVTQPDLRNINGYIGRKFAPTFKSTDNYLSEPTDLRQNYQLEPGVVVKNKITNDTEFFSSYIDLIQQVGASGGLNNNHTRLFANESYSYDGLFDFDKFINFNQYYWLENGPMAVGVYANGVPLQETFTVTRDPSTGSYRFSTASGVENPTIQLAYGGTYNFIVNQPGYPFWIQTDPGTSGTKQINSHLSSRDVLGVTNNGTDVGTITFKVPQPNAQDYFVNMPVAGTVDLSTALSYTQVQGQRLSNIVSSIEGGIDGITSINQINLKSLIFVNSDLDDTKWTVNGYTVPTVLRRNAWFITMNSDSDPLITLNPLAQSFVIGKNQKVLVNGGVSRADYIYYLASDYLNLNVFNQEPDITAPLTTLYYQDGQSLNLFGAFSLLYTDDSVVDVQNDIIGATTYQSPNGVVFTNGLKVTFDSSAMPSEYQDQTYYVEGVGTSIQLVNVSQIINPEPFADNGLGLQDYITINRASADSNPWSRSNCWFHIDIINASAGYNGVTPVLDQTLRANRPIIEFYSGLQLFNFGVVAKQPVDILDFTITDSRNAVELQPYGFQLGGTTLQNGMRVIFASDYDPTVRDLIYVVNIVTIPTYVTGSNPSGRVINLVAASDSAIDANNNIIITSGTYQGLQYYYNGSTWIPGQQKNNVNQAPLFDIVDSSGVSISTYTDSSFAGTEVFSYTQGTGSNDSVLGFPLSYRTFNQIGDIQFTNNFDADTVTYTDGTGTVQTDVNINTLGWVLQNTSLTANTIRNTWTTNTEQTKQFQIFSGVYDGNNAYFKIDITQQVELTVPYFRVYRNSTQITAWSLVTVGALNYVQITDSNLTTGDQIDILIYSNNQVSQLGYYEVPSNLDNNSRNDNFTSLTLGQLRNHVSTMVANSNRIVGNFPGDSNLRDLNIKTQGGSILQHASPVIYSEMFLVDQDTNFLKGLDLARREYSRFKNKIIEMSQRAGDVDYTNIPALLDTLLKKINSAKNKSFSWYYSDMVPYGDIKNTITYTVQSAEIVDYEISSIFSDVTLSATAVLVYHNGVQLTKDIDYTFDTTRAGITISKALTVGDTIVIYEYSSTDGNYIPETPTKLGLYPKFTPSKFYDTTYVTPIYVIQGHDGSITPCFGDYRDDLLLEFEQRIYNNIKVNQTTSVLDLYDYTPGRFRNSDYSLNEFTQLLSNSFMLWIGNNKVDYITNTAFVASNPFTWCYNQFLDNISGQRLPGYWRAIYKYFYDTDRPHTSPWEMLGFSQEPSWWESRYGSAPYTGGNMVLWNDLAAGYIWNNGNPYTDQRFVRNGLLNIIPVDLSGALIPPSRVLVKSLNSAQTSFNFKIGDQGPVETAWRRSSDYPFAFNQALALAKPAFYFGTLVGTNTYYKNTSLNQYISTESLQRVSPSDIDINGVVATDEVGNLVSRSASYINWIADYLRNQGIDPGAKLTDYLTNVNVQLAYKMAGYTDQSFLQVIAEQSSPNSTNSGVVIPNESYSIELYKSTPTSLVAYSAVVVERTSTGYTVSGYDTNNPYFTVIPSLVNGNSYQIPVLNDAAVIYQDFQQYKVTIPYGYEFTTRQQVVDFLVSYQRYLQGVGFVFSDMDPDLNVQRDWLLSVTEYLTWAQQGWGASSILVLSPVLDKITFFSTTGVVDKIQNTPTQSCILDTSYNFIKYSQMSVNRSSSVNGNVFNITANSGQTIALLRISVVEYEHIVIFDNIDIFNDVIYVPELGNRQYRLKLVGKKTGSWTGDMNPPGFVFNNTSIDAWQQGTDYLMGTLVTYKGINYTALQDIPGSTTFDSSVWAQLSTQELQTGLLPNFSYNAEKFNRFNDVDNPEVLGDFHLYSDSAIGFQPRQYMTDFGLDEVTQAKFYQGYIRQKGTMNAINAFNALGVNGATSNIDVYEEWALRVGEYGALNNNRSIDLILTEGTFNGDPVTLTLLPNGGTVTSNNVVGVYPSQLFKTEGTYTPAIYKNRDASSNYRDDIQTAGYVDIADTDHTVFDLSNIASLSDHVSSIAIGDKVWVAKDPSNNWNIYRITETDTTIVQITYSVDNVGVITTNTPHNRSFNDYVVISSFDDRVNGVYFVYNIIDAYNFSVVFQGQAATQIKQAMSITGAGALYYLQSVRIQQPTDLNTIEPMNDWLDGDKLWIDDDYTVDGWAVYNKSTPWTGNTSIFNANMKLAANSYVTNSGYGSVVSLSSNGSFAIASSPSYNNGYVYAFVSNTANGNTFTVTANILQHSGGVKFGSSLETSGNLLYIGNPGSSSQQGFVHVHQYFSSNSTFPWKQTLSSPSMSNIGDAFGTSVSASADGAWLYVSAPTTGNVYVYQANVNSYYTYSNTISVGSSSTSQFGYTVKTTSTGNQVAISAPQQTVNGVSGAGSVYVFDRSIESFYANGTTYHTTHPISSTSRVYLNSALITNGFTTSSNTLTFTTAPAFGSLITIETNYFQLLETLTSPTPTSGAAFGTSTWISGNDADVFVSSPGYTSPGYYSGAVYRFVNQGASYGTITGTTFNGVVNLGDSIRINGVNVAFTSGNTITAANTINNANIPGITAIAQSYGTLTINSNIATPYQRLIIGPGSGNIMSNLGLNVFADVQTILHPTNQDVSQFGYKVMSSLDSSSLVISASRGNAYNSMTFDADTTFFEGGSTSFFDGIEGTGAVFVYGLVNQSLTSYAQDQYVLIQSLQNSSLSFNDQFGASMSMNSNTMLVGAPGDDNSTTFDPIIGNIATITNAGTYYIYNNFTGNVGWDVVKQETPQVDIDSISRLYLYNANTNVITTNLDYIDPAKGKVLGAAQEDLDFITPYDPAVYNIIGTLDGAPDVSNSIDYFWGPEHTTETWWNTGLVRYVNYEQGNVEYRASNWGTTFPGSQIQVCEWVESDLPPSAYPGPGTALYPDNSAYSLVTTINPNTKLATGTYYYWVTGKTSLEPNSVHINTISTIQDIIENPQAQSIPYATVVQDDSISLYGISTYLSGNSTILHADYDVLRNTNIIHSEYQLVQEGNPNSQPPTRVVNKILDSLSGIDANGFPVPDPSLSPQQSIGLGVAPNQTVFIDRTAALQNWVDYTNSILLQYPIVSERNINALYDSDPLPSATTYDLQVGTYAQLTYIETGPLTIGYTVLVTTDETYSNLWTMYEWTGIIWSIVSYQTYYTPTYWYFVDWYDSTYDSTVLPTYVVQSETDVASLTLTVGETVKVLNSGNGEFTVYRVNSDGTTSVVGIQNGTIQLSSLIYTNAPANEIRVIALAFAEYIWIGTLSQYYNSTFFFLINYILTEQPSVDWAFKTSFLGIIHYFKTLGQPAAYSPDDQTYYEDYINEVKPYRTSIREYLLQYEGNDEYYGDSTDFDIPSTFLSSLNTYSSPFVGNINNTNDANWAYLSTKPQYSQWYNNHTYSIGNIVPTNTGANYTLPPVVTVVGGGGSGANIQAIINASGQVTNYQIISSGTGYTSEPTVFINGNGTGATAYAKLVNHYQLDSLPIVELVANSNVTLTAGNIISQANTNAYGTVYISSNANIITLIDSVGTFNTTDYIFNDFANLNTYVTDVTNTIEFVNNSYNTVRNLATTVKFDRTTYNSNVIAWSPNATVVANSVVSFNGSAYQALANVYSSAILTLSGNATVTVGSYITQANTNANAIVISISANTRVITVGNLTNNFVRRAGNILINNVDSDTKPMIVSNVFDYTKYQLLDPGSFNNASDRITAYYSPTAGMSGRELAQVMSGIEYPGVEVTGVSYANTASSYTSIFSNSSIYTYANTLSIYSANVSIPTVGLDISSPYTLFTGNVINQPDTGASGVVYNTSTGNIVTLVDVVGTFSIGSPHYLSINNGANLGVTVTGVNPYQLDSGENLVDFTQLGYSTGLPITVTDLDTSTQVEVTVTEVDTWRVIVSGINFPTIPIGANVALKYYDFDNPTYFDSSISNTYTSSNIATVIDGGAYYDTFSSHAPEEFIPGVTFDNLNMAVYTGMVGLSTGVGLNNPPVNANTVYTANIGYRMVQSMNGNAASTNSSLWPAYYGISQSQTTTLASNLNVTDDSIFISNILAITAPSVTSRIPGVIMINGEKIVFWGIDYANNALTNIRRAVDGTGAPTVHVVGSAVVDTNSTLEIPGGSTVHTNIWLNGPIGPALDILLEDTSQDFYDWQANANISGNIVPELITTIGATSSTVTDGSGLQGSTSAQALFLKRLY